MKTLNIEDVPFPGMIQDAYMTCKYLERKGIPLDTVTLGNCHDAIEEAVDNHQLPVTQVIIEGAYPTSNGIFTWVSIEGYLIEA